jgi:hypothetical protein
MVVQKNDDDLAKVRKMVEAADLRERNAFKRWFTATIKETRRWRMTRELEPVEVVDSSGSMRRLKRF